jgi:hypothetical protein
LVWTVNCIVVVLRVLEQLALTRTNKSVQFGPLQSH